MMSSYRLFCYKDYFKNYKRITSPKTQRIPAGDYDEFALLVCVTLDGEIGFYRSEQAGLLLGALAKDSYILSGSELFYEGNILQSESREYAFRPKDNDFGVMIKEYESSELDNKKFQIMKRHGRACPAPGFTLLTEFLKCIDRPISVELYESIVGKCHFVTKAIASGEHGQGAFEVFARNLDVFFETLGGLMGEDGELIFVDHSQLPFH